MLDWKRSCKYLKLPNNFLWRKQKYNVPAKETIALRLKKTTRKKTTRHLVRGETRNSRRCKVVASVHPLGVAWSAKDGLVSRRNKQHYHVAVLTMKKRSSSRFSHLSRPLAALFTAALDAVGSTIMYSSQPLVTCNGPIHQPLPHEAIWPTFTSKPSFSWLRESL